MTVSVLSPRSVSISVLNPGVGLHCGVCLQASYWFSPVASVTVKLRKHDAAENGSSVTAAPSQGFH